jgi:endonuclease/exonuclease/phosphatase family metal-dependent hydrolase
LGAKRTESWGVISLLEQFTFLADYDVVFLQECFKNAFEINTNAPTQSTMTRLLNNMGFDVLQPKDVEFFSPQWINSGLMVAARKGLFLEHGGSIQYTDMASIDNLAAKGFLWATITSGGTNITLVNTHQQTTYKGSCLDKRPHEDTRAKQRIQLIDFLLGPSGPSMDRVILAGDFNHREVGEENDYKTMGLQNYLNGGLDWVFSNLLFTDTSWTIPRDIYPSDHLPVSVTIRV